MYKPIFNFLATSDKDTVEKFAIEIMFGVTAHIYTCKERVSSTCLKFLCSGKGLLLEMSAFKIFHGGNSTFSTRLLKPNFHVSSSHRHSTTVSLETRICFLHIILCFSLFKSQGIPFLLEYSKPLLESHNHFMFTAEKFVALWMVSIIPENAISKKIIYIYLKCNVRYIILLNFIHLVLSSSCFFFYY